MNEAAWLAKRIRSMGPAFVVAFVDCPRSQLVRYHDSLGRMLRNEFKFWDDHWTPELVNGVDHSPDHPDQRSQRIIELTWELLQ
jgi:hypothetical protein